MQSLRNELKDTRIFLNTFQDANSPLSLKIVQNIPLQQIKFFIQCPQEKEDLQIMVFLPVFENNFVSFRKFSNERK